MDKRAEFSGRRGAGLDPRSHTRWMESAIGRPPLRNGLPYGQGSRLTPAGLVRPPKERDPPHPP